MATRVINSKRGTSIKKEEVKKAKVQKKEVKKEKEE
tara:strand:+ start:112 stop:219 length:108 start_codon:yes stop_codon:yes gene_type:complete